MKGGHRKSLFMNLSKSLIKTISDDKKIKTTLAKAKAFKPKVERMITTMKGFDSDEKIASVRRAVSFFGDKEFVMKHISLVSDKYKDRNGGYTRIIKLPRRKSDGSKMCFVELV
ncbi:50S ribosomal protein L17 [Candidatus Nesciobacter abundans]|nr:50S ribosomal protein L17 [Candidatus Nesciobacter abundans]